MLAPLFLVTLGGILAYSAMKGISVTDLFTGKTGATLDPSGAHQTSPPAASGSAPTDPNTTTIGGDGSWTAPAGGAHSFKGSHAADLNKLASIAQNNFGLTITATTNGTHVPTSLHYAGEAFDSSGSDAAMRGFSQYVLDNYGNEVSELIHNPGFAVKNGQVVNGAVVYAAVWEGHRNHVHVGWA